MEKGALAKQLIEATEQRVAIEALTVSEPALTIDVAYDVQDAVIEAIAQPVVAAKLGLTSRAKQEQMGVSEPLYGWLTENMQLQPGEPLICEELIQPRIEPEIAFDIGADLAGSGVTAAHVLSATTAVVPALDVLDSRFAGYQFTLADVVADNASAARFTLGSTPVPPDGIDLSLVGCIFEKNGELVATASGAAVLDHPAEAVAWFVRKLADRNRALPAGSTVLAGGLTAAIEVQAGDEVSATFDRLGSVELKCG